MIRFWCVEVCRMYRRNRRWQLGRRKSLKSAVSMASTYVRLGFHKSGNK